MASKKPQGTLSSSAFSRARILLIKPSSLGDIVHTFPVVSALKAQWLASHITWLVKRQWAELVERAEGIDRVWPVDAMVRSWVRETRALRASIAGDLIHHIYVRPTPEPDYTKLPAEELKWLREYYRHNKDYALALEIKFNLWFPEIGN